MGMFDDLVPGANPTGKGMFDDLIPTGPTVREQYETATPQRDGFLNRPPIKGPWGLPTIPDPLDVAQTIYRKMRGLPGGLQSQLSAAGVGTEGAPGKARALASLGPDDDETTRRALEKELGVPVQVRTGKISGYREYSTDGKKWNLVNPPGLQAADIGAGVGPALPAVGAGVGALGGLGGLAATPVGAVALTTLGAATGAFVGEVTRLGMGRDAGIHDLTDDQILDRAWRQAMGEAAGAVIVPAVAQVGKLILSRVFKGQSPLLDPVPDAAVTAAEGAAHQMEGATGQPFPVTAGQAARYGATTPAERVRAEDTQAVERVMAQGKYGEPIKGVHELQDQAVGAMVDNVLQLPTPDNAPQAERVGQNIQRFMAQGPQRGIQNVTAQTGRAEAAAENAAALGGDPAMVAGRNIQAAAQTGRDQVFTGLSRAYQADLDAVAPHLMADAAPVRAAARSPELQAVRDTIFPSLSRENIDLIMQAAEAGATADPAVFRQIPLSVIQVGLSDLRRAERMGVSPAVVSRLEQSMLQVRNAALDGADPALRARVAQLDLEWAQASEYIDRRTVGEILRQKPGSSQYSVDPEDVVKRVLSDATGAHDLAYALDRYAADFPGAREAVRRGIMGAYEAQVVNRGANGTVANPAAHATFMKNYRSSLESFFSPAEIANMFERPGQAAIYLRQMQVRETRAIADLNRSFGMKMQEWEPQTVVDRLWNRPTDVGRVMRTLESQGNTSLANDFRSSLLAKFRAESSRINPNTRETEIVPELLLNNMQKYRATLETFGPDFLRNMDILREGLRLAARGSPQGGQQLIDQAAMNRSDNTFRLVTRFFTGWASQRGRRTRVIMDVYGKTAQRAVANALASPQALNDFVRLRTMSPESARAYSVLGALGAEGLLLAGEDD